MGETGVPSQAWLEKISSMFAADGAVEDRILAIIRQAHARYRGNAYLALDDQLPYSVFRRIVEKLESIMIASQPLYDELCQLHGDTLGRTELVETARELLLRHYDGVIAVSPENLDARLGRARLRFDGRDPRGAEEDYEAAIRCDGAHLEARRGQIRALVWLRNDVEALARLAELLERAPDDVFGRYERARLWLRHDFVPEALTDIDLLITLTEDSDALLFAARELLATGRVSDAIAVCRRLPASVDGHLVLGAALLDIGEIEPAVEQLKSVLALVDRHESRLVLRTARAKALTLLGDAHVRAGEPVPALDRYIEAASMGWWGQDLKRRVVMTAWETLAAGAPPVPDPGAPVDEARWIEPAMSARFVDGRPVEVTSSDLGSVPYLERLPWADAVERLRLFPMARDNSEVFPALFRLELPRLRHLEIEAERFGYAGLSRMVEAPFFTRLESLTLTGCDLGPAALQLLAERVPHGLRELRVNSANARPRLPRARTLRHVLRSWSLPNLETLDLGNTNLSVAEVMALTEASLPNLTELVLAGNHLRGLDIAGFLDSPLISGLHTIDISHVDEEPALMLGILDRLDALALRWAWARGSWASDDLRAVRDHPAYPRLEGVDLGEPGVPEETWLALLD